MLSAISAGLQEFRQPVAWRIRKRVRKNGVPAVIPSDVGADREDPVPQCAMEANQAYGLRVDAGGSSAAVSTPVAQQSLVVLKAG